MLTTKSFFKRAKLAEGILSRKERKERKEILILKLRELGELRVMQKLGAHRPA